MLTLTLTRELIRIAPSATKALASKPTVPVYSGTALLPHYTLGYETGRSRARSKRTLFGKDMLALYFKMPRHGRPPSE